MKISLFLSLLLFITIIHPAFYKDNQTDIYVKDYTGQIITSGNVSFEDSRIVIGVKENVTKDQVEAIAKSVGGEIAGWAIGIDNEYDSYFIDLPAGQREIALLQLKFNSQVVYAIRNDVSQNSAKIYDLVPYDNQSFREIYFGEIISNSKDPVDANTMVIYLPFNFI